MKKKVLYISPTDPSNINGILKALNSQNKYDISVCFKNIVPKDYYQNPLPIIEKVFEKIRLPLDRTSFNARIRDMLKFNFYDVVLILKGNEIYPSTLQMMRRMNPNTKLVSWSLDDMFAKHNRSMYYTWGLKYYDLVVTTKSYNLNELPKLGAKKILFLNNAYIRGFHDAFHVPHKLKKGVVFVGTAEDNRISFIEFAGQHELPITVYGSGWEKFKYKFEKYKSISIIPQNLTGEEYPKKISSAKIAISFLRKKNRDLQNSRSIEIPACATAMLSEFSDELCKLFDENENVMLFRNKDDFVSKLKKLLSDDALTNKIGQNGYKLIKQGSFSYDNRVKETMEYLND